MFVFWFDILIGTFLEAFGCVKFCRLSGYVQELQYSHIFEDLEFHRSIIIGICYMPLYLSISIIFCQLMGYHIWKKVMLPNFT